MEEKVEGSKPVRRIFTAEQSSRILKDIERCKTIKEELAKHKLAQSLYHKCRRQLEVGVRASLRNAGRWHRRRFGDWRRRTASSRRHC